MLDSKKKSMAATGKPDREPANRDRTVAPPPVPRFHGSHGSHGSTVEPWNRGAKLWPTVPRLNRGTVEPWSQTEAHGSTVQRWNRGTVEP